MKEADALSANGHSVRVVTTSTRPEYARYDSELIKGKQWRHMVIAADRSSLRGQLRWLTTGVAQRFARALLRLGVKSRLVRDTAASRYGRALEQGVAVEAADVVIGHNLAALGPAARAAHRIGARLGFDIEDLHVEVLADCDANDLERVLIASVEREYLPRCQFLTASSPGIAAEIARRYDVPEPQVVLNVFPWGDRPTRVIEVRDRQRDLPSLYWYSQTIGPDRGLEDAVDAVARIGMPVHLHLRGEISDHYRTALVARATRLGISGALHLHESASPTMMIELAAEHDIGLALEQPTTVNRDLCITNKLFTYMVAGIAVAATDTVGQRAVLHEVPDVGFLYRPGDVNGLAAGIRALVESPSRLALAKRQSADAARQRFCWEVERDRLVRYLTSNSDISIGAKAAAVENM